MSAQRVAARRSISSRTARDPPRKRQRVNRACQNCRCQKIKCDGVRPICSRCEGYGYNCSWAEDMKPCKKTLDTAAPNNIVSNGPIVPTSSSLRLAIQSYHKLIRSVRVDLPDSARATVDVSLNYIQRRLPSDLISLDLPWSTSECAVLPQRSVDNSTKTQRYLGEASDVRFFHAIKRKFQEGNQVEGTSEKSTQSYDQCILHLEARDSPERLPDLPTRELADSYIEIYFFTIHIAYPFVSKISFMLRYENFWVGNSDVAQSSSWLPLLYTIFAIGAYYTSFPRCENADRQAHLQYFRQAISLSDSIMTDCTLENTQMLLAQCFFLLAMGQTDRCWNTLGLAIRIAQSIGLHVEDSLKQPVSGLTVLEQETIRRTWYSMYVLDRLLALQLGRPVAIHEEDYCVNLPSETDDSKCLFDGGSARSLLESNLSPIDYFLSVINFSQILGHVIRDLYRPSQVASDPDRMLSSTAALDVRLREWKFSLPRHLRFDLGHTFEKLMTLKRQRNMLAIKYHHLRTLMHRPYLCLAWLQQHDRPLMALLGRANEHVNALERVCIYEAQQTAHLLHNVADEKSLVQDFPWWQMISCLLCASSVLLVARSCLEPHQVDFDVESQTLDEDAETCLKVFDALSVNSDAARRARDMMKDLKRAHIQPRTNCKPSPMFNIDIMVGSAVASSGPMLMVEDSNDGVPGVAFVENLEHPLSTGFDYGMRSTGFEWQSWPGDLSDPVAWSAQFLDPTQIFPGNEQGRASFGI